MGMTYSEAKKVALFTNDVHALLTPPSNNPKILKNMKLGIATFALHLAPARVSGREVCPGRTPGCTAACLHTAGNPASMAGKERARINRTKLYFDHRDVFLDLLRHEIRRAIAWAEKRGLKAAFRLNATSDIPFERVGRPLASVIEDFHGVQFYDYTKIKARAMPDYRKPSNYHIVYSAADGNHDDAREVLAAGGSVTAVFRKHLPAWFWDRPVVDGDAFDFLPAHPDNVVIGLKAKGRAKTDTTGFVLDV
jgi:hypothetical protein